jgi:hypothetical protein
MDGRQGQPYRFKTALKADTVHMCHFLAFSLVIALWDRLPAIPVFMMEMWGNMTFR